MRHGFYPEDPRVYKEVRALLDAGYSVDVVCLRRSGQSPIEVIDGVRVYRLPHRHRRGSIMRYVFEYGLSFSLMALLVTILYVWRHYDFFQVNTLPDALVFVTLIPRLLGGKVLLDMHEPAPELWITKYGDKRFPILLRLQIFTEQWAIRYANSVITVNETIRKRFVERGANGRKINVIPNVPEEKYFTSGKLCNSQKDFTLITHGTIEQHYGHEIIVRALPMLRNKINNLRVYIVGDGHYVEKLLNLSEELGCSDLIFLTGYVPLSEIAGYIVHADVGLVTFLPSPFSELCQPNKLFEYIALGKPAIVSRLRAIEEIFDDSCVMFFEPGNHEDLARCVLELYNNPERGKKLAANASRRYEKIRWKKTKKSIRKLLRI